MKGKTGIIAKFHRTGLVIYSHFRKGRTLSYSRINSVRIFSYKKFKRKLYEKITVCSYKFCVDFTVNSCVQRHIFRILPE